MKRHVLAGGVLLAGLSGCASSDGGAVVVVPTKPRQVAAPPALPPGPASPGARARFAPPVVRGGTIDATVRLKDFVLSARDVGRSPRPGEGHLHFQLDGGRFDRPRYAGALGRLAAKLGVSGLYTPSVRPKITYRHLPPGRYTLLCYLANNNHTATGVETEVTFVVR